MESKIPEVRVAVTGGREFDNPRLVADIFKEIAKIAWKVTLIHGDAIGLDTIAAKEAQESFWWTEPYPVTKEEWKTYGKKAGHLRNRKMLSESKPHILLSFPGGNGTADCVKAALSMGIPVESFYDMPLLTLYAKIDRAIGTIIQRLDAETNENTSKKDLTPS
jgi:predicted Rossmann-fold nucleotide-binding protein